MSNVTNNKPANASAYGMLFQMRSPFSLHSQASDAVYSQFYIDSTGKAFTRSLVNYAWTSWRDL